MTAGIFHLSGGQHVKRKVVVVVAPAAAAAAGEEEEEEEEVVVVVAAVAAAGVAVVVVAAAVVAAVAAAAAAAAAAAGKVEGTLAKKILTNMEKTEMSLMANQRKVREILRKTREKIPGRTTQSALTGERTQPLQTN